MDKDRIGYDDTGSCRARTLTAFEFEDRRLDEVIKEEGKPCDNCPGPCREEVCIEHHFGPDGQEA